MSTIKDVVVIIILIAATIAMFFYGMNKSEKAECIKLQEQAGEYANFYITNWQYEMCQKHEIEINVPVAQNTNGVLPIGR